MEDIEQAVTNILIDIDENGQYTVDIIVIDDEGNSRHIGTIHPGYIQGSTKAIERMAVVD